MSGQSQNTYIGIHYGVMYDSIEEQVSAQGYTLAENAEKYEKSREAINRLRLQELMTDAVADKVLKRLHNRIIKDLKPREVTEV